MKIYFSGSIRGGHEDADIYKQIISELKNYGIVLTEHIGSKVLENNLSDEEIHDRDLKWVMESDVVVAEVSTPSLGVGYEIGRAAEFNKPIVCLYRKNSKKQVSAMIAGCAQVKAFEYSNIEDAKQILDEQFRDINKDWRNIIYLKSGSAVQFKAYNCLLNLGIFDSLAEYNPTLTGSIPIGISVKESDLDIACRFFDADRFERIVESIFGEYEGFKIEQKEKAGYWVVIANFKFEGFNIEIYGSAYPVTAQNSYRHMLIEDRILKLLGEDFNKEVIKLKELGIKTEPAFAKLLNITGDPYSGLLKLEGRSNNEIKRLWNLKKHMLDTGA
ncbi:DUF4269 domain-containing protein [Marinifilum sp.]|uniref:DUF4269 domain-containing protein n=1 Tax=Marinifilum sp. TaxID=2033137 RepID=UPI003BAAB9B1